MKQITICGNLGANAVRRAVTDGREIMTFSVAVNDAKGTTWFNCVSSMRKNFDYLTKGQCVCVVGDLQATMYKNNIDLTINADRIELCGKSSAPAETDTQVTETHVEHFDPS